MADTPISTQQMTIEEYIRLYETEGPFEIIDGERIIVSPAVSGHTNIISIIYDALLLFIKGKGLGIVRSEAPYVLPDQFSTNWVKGSKVPDIMFVSQLVLDEFKSKYPNHKQLPFVLIPDLVVEVVSQNDQYSDVEKKVAKYQEDGVKLTWVVDPQTEKVTVYTQDITHQVKLSGEMMLTGGDVLPGFEIKVAEIFA